MYSNNNIRAIIQENFPFVTEKQIKQFESLLEIYNNWNEKINVISRKDMENLFERHILHSLSIAKIISFKPNTKILDVGTGGGFPGIPLAILFPEVDFYLVDSIGKKINVVNAVSQELGLENIRAEQIRAENVKGYFDFIISRAVTSMPVFLSWIENKISKIQYHEMNNGIIYLKGGDLQEELLPIEKDKKKRIKIYNIYEFFPSEFFETKKIVHIYPAKP